MAWRNWKHESRGDWGRDVPDGQGLSREELTVGSLQRIADALERIADLLDPAKRSEAHKAAREKAARDADRDLWRQWCDIVTSDQGERMVVRPTKKFFGQAKPDVAEKRAIERVAFLARRHFDAGPPAGYEFRSPPTEEEKAAIRKAIAEFNPATFDWAGFVATVTMSDLLRSRFLAVLGRMPGGRP